MPTTVVSLTFILRKLRSLKASCINDPDPLSHQPRAFDLANLSAVQVFGYLREATIRFATFVSVHRRHLKPVDAFPFELDCSFMPMPPILICQPCRTNRELRSTPIVLSPSKIAA